MLFQRIKCFRARAQDINSSITIVCIYDHMSDDLMTTRQYSVMTMKDMMMLMVAIKMAKIADYADDADDVELTSMMILTTIMMMQMMLMTR